MNRPEAPWPVETRTRPFIDPEEIDRIMGRSTHRPHRPTERHGETLAFRIFMIGAWPVIIAMFLLLGWAR